MRITAGKMSASMIVIICQGFVYKIWDTCCDTPAQGLIGLIRYSYQQVATFFPEANIQRTPKLSVFDSEKFGYG